MASEQQSNMSVHLPPEWEAILKLSLSIRQDNKPLPKQELWPIKGLARRAANISRGLAVLVMHGLWAEVLILGRALMEIEIIMKWLLKEGGNARLESYIAAINEEKKRLRRKMSSGVSVSAQILSELIGEALDAEIDADSDDRNNTGQNKRWPPISIRDMSKEVDMERNYDIVYWLQSIFTHSHPLSVIESHPPEFGHLLCHMFTCEASSGLPRATALTGMPMVILHVFATADTALQLGLGSDIEHAWELVRSSVMNEEKGVQWVPSNDIPVGDVRVVYADGTSKQYSPQRSKIKEGKPKGKRS